MSVRNGKRLLSLLLAVCLMMGCLPLSAGAATTPIILGNSVSGSISSNTDKNFYKFSISESGKVNFNFNGTMAWIDFYLFDGNDQQLWHESSYWNSTSQRIVKDISFDLVAGTYSFCVSKYLSNTGYYTIETSYNSAKESFKESGSGNNNSINTASNITLGRTYNGQIALNDDKDFYRFNLSESGKVNFKFNGTMAWIDFYLFDGNDQQLWHESSYWNSTSQRIVKDISFDLVAGTYSFCVSKYLSNTGYYTIETSYTPAGESFSESLTKKNNSLNAANSISLGKTYNGQIALNDDKDFYKFSTSGNDEIPINFSGNMQSVTLYVYNSEGDGSKAWKKTYYADSSSGKINVNDHVICHYGTFYFCIERSSGTGNYSFSLKGDPVDVADDPDNPDNTTTPAITSFRMSGVWGTADGVIQGGVSKSIQVTLPADADLDHIHLDITASPSNAKILLDSQDYDPNATYSLTGDPTFTVTVSTADGKSRTYQVFITIKEENSDSSFSDVRKGAYYYDAVSWAVENGITVGTDKTHFSPEQRCTRGQIVTFLWRALGKTEPNSGLSNFSDVKKNAYYEKAVRWAVEEGITNGTGNGKFSPEEGCTRAQAVTFLWRAAGEPEPSRTAKSFSDVKKGSYYEKAVKWAVEKGITAGTGNGKFSPEDRCTRAQIVSFLYRAYH